MGEDWLVSARYDGHADWYDETFRGLGTEDGSAALVARLLGPPDPGSPICLDIGCGTGLNFAALAGRGYQVIGVDLSADQLRIARTRNPRVVRGDAGRLPFADLSIPAVAMTFIHTDVDDFPAAVAEATRVLRASGRLVYVGVHPAFMGPFIDRRDEAAEQELRIDRGYGDERLQRDQTGHFPVRARVGARNLTLQAFLAAFVAPPRLRLLSVTELDTKMRPWRSPGLDGHLLPWNIAVTAVAA
jgi:SAM-dependent methyltransferase